MPSLIIVAVLIMLRTSFCAVPAFIRVEPVITSGPTKVCIVRSAVLDIGLFSTQTTATVFAPLLFANSMAAWVYGVFPRSEEHTSELQSLTNLVCRLLLEKKNHLISHDYHESR